MMKCVLAPELATIATLTSLLPSHCVVTEFDSHWPAPDQWMFAVDGCDTSAAYTFRPPTPEIVTIARFNRRPVGGTSNTMSPPVDAFFAHRIVRFAAEGGPLVNVNDPCTLGD